jgi:hypothetical protein
MFIVTYTITTAAEKDLFLLDLNIPTDIQQGLAVFRAEAEIRGCVINSEDSEDSKVRKAFFIWEDEDVVSEFTKWCNENNYNFYYDTFVKIIESTGGTITRTTEEI